MSVQLIGLGWLALFSEYTLGTLGEERDRKLRLEINVISKMSTRHRQYSKHGSREEPCFLHWYRIEGTTTVIRLFVFTGRGQTSDPLTQVGEDKRSVVPLATAEKNCLHPGTWWAMADSTGSRF